MCHLQEINLSRQNSKSRLKSSSRNEYALPKIKEENATKTDLNNYDMGFVNLVDKNHEMFDHDSSSLKPLFNYDKKINSKDKMIPIHITNANIEVTDDRKVIYRKIHKYSKKEYLIEISKTKTKYFISSIELNKKQFSQAIELHTMKGSVEAFADHISFKYGKLVILDMKELLNKPTEYQTTRANPTQSDRINSQSNQVGNAKRELSLPSISPKRQNINEDMTHDRENDLNSMHGIERTNMSQHKRNNDESIEFPLEEKDG